MHDFMKLIISAREKRMGNSRAEAWLFDVSDDDTNELDLMLEILTGFSFLKLIWIVEKVRWSWGYHMDESRKNFRKNQCCVNVKFLFLPTMNVNVNDMHEIAHGTGVKFV